MVEKKYKDSKIAWDESLEKGTFMITSNRNKSAKGSLIKSITGKLIAYIDRTNYADSYVNKKVKSTLNEIFGDDTNIISIQSDTIDCLNDHVYTNVSFANGLEVNDKKIIQNEFVSYCVGGAHDCGGDLYTGPVEVIFKGIVIGTCAGTPQEYAKFKIS